MYMDLFLKRIYLGYAHVVKRFGFKKLNPFDYSLIIIIISLYTENPKKFIIWQRFKIKIVFWVISQENILQDNSLCHCIDFSQLKILTYTPPSLFEWYLEGWLFVYNHCQCDSWLIQIAQKRINEIFEQLYKFY